MRYIRHHTSSRRGIGLLAAIILLMTLSGCATTGTKEPSPEEKRQNDIEILVDALALKRVKPTNVCKRLISYGDEAVPELQRNIENRIFKVRLLCIYCLGQIYMKNKSQKVAKLEPRFESRLFNDPMHLVRLEAAATLCALKNYKGLPLIIEALYSEKPYVRMVASQILYRNFQKTFHFKYDDPDPERRKRAAKRWEEWWEKEKAKLTARSEKSA